VDRGQRFDELEDVEVVASRRCRPAEPGDQERRDVGLVAVHVRSDQLGNGKAALGDGPETRDLVARFVPGIVCEVLVRVSTEQQRAALASDPDAMVRVRRVRERLLGDLDVLGPDRFDEPAPRPLGNRHECLRRSRA
jgi:hypothetical protein